MKMIKIKGDSGNLVAWGDGFVVHSRGTGEKRNVEIPIFAIFAVAVVVGGVLAFVLDVVR